MDSVIWKLEGANMDIDLATPKDEIQWQQDRCPWNEAEGRDMHKCAVKNISIPPYFCGTNIWTTSYVVIQMRTLIRGPKGIKKLLNRGLRSAFFPGSNPKRQ